MIGTGRLELRRRDTNKHLAEILAAEEPDQLPRRVVESVDDVLAVLDATFAQPRRHIAQEIGLRAAKSETMKPRKVSRLVRIARMSSGTRSGRARGISVAL